MDKRSRTIGLWRSKRLVMRRWMIAISLMFFSLASTAIHAEVAVIVNAANSATLDDEAIARIYLAQVRKFPNGDAAQPIDQKDGSPAREDFTTKLIKRAPAHIKSYWAQQKFTGNLKPIKQLTDDDAIVKFVSENANSIAYVDAAKVKPGVKVVAKF